MAEPTWQETVAEVWHLFKETDAKFKETDAKFKETDVKFKETDVKFKETQGELDRRFKETDVKFKETDQKINQLSGLFSSQWGKLLEALVQPAALRLFQERGIRVHYVYQRVKGQVEGHTLELDLLLENSDEVVVIEVKSTLKVSDVTDFLADLGRFLDFFPRYRSYRVYAGAAGLNIDEEADRFAYRQGLFVLGLSGEGVVQLKNDAAFSPRDFAQPVV